jgi:hypothetical protein
VSLFFAANPVIVPAVLKQRGRQADMLDA